MSIPRYVSANKGKGKMQDVDADDDGSQNTCPSETSVSASRNSRPQGSPVTTSTSSSSLSPMARPSSIGRRVPVHSTTSGSLPRQPAPTSVSGHPNTPAPPLPVHIPSAAPVPRTRPSSVVVHVSRSRIPLIATVMGLHPDPVVESPAKRPSSNPEDHARKKTTLSVATESVDVAAADETESLSESDPGPALSSPLDSSEQNTSFSPRLHTARLALIRRISRTDTHPSTCDVEERIHRGVPLASQALSTTCEASSGSASMIENAQTSKAALRVALEEERKIDDAGETSIRRLPYAQAKELDPLMIESRLQVANLEARLKEMGSGYERLSSVSDQPNRVHHAGEAGAALPSIDKRSAQITQEPHTRSALSASQEIVSPPSAALDGGVMTSAASHLTYIDTSVSETERRIELLQQYSAGPNQVAPTQGPTSEQEKSRSTVHSHRWIIQWRIVAIIISVSISLGFISGSFYKLAITQTYESVLNNLYTSAETITSEDGSSNLTISWVNGRAAGLNATYFLNTTLASTTEEVAPDAYAFILHWHQEFENTGQGSRLKSVVTIPVPSFSEEFVHSAALLSLFAIFYLLFHFLLEVTSRRWHEREETGIYWTSALLRAFENVRRWIAFVASAIITALVWTAAMRALLLA